GKVNCGCFMPHLSTPPVTSRPSPSPRKKSCPMCCALFRGNSGAAKKVAARDREGGRNRLTSPSSVGCTRKRTTRPGPRTDGKRECGWELAGTGGREGGLGGGSRGRGAGVVEWKGVG
ncbi:hypothetical protein Naga_102585g1, partial [Nannochloropsis gaditana]